MSTSILETTILRIISHRKTKKSTKRLTSAINSKLMELMTTKNRSIRPCTLIKEENHSYKEIDTFMAKPNRHKQSTEPTCMQTLTQTRIQNIYIYVYKRS